jgi:hypothetical protein
MRTSAKLCISRGRGVLLGAPLLAAILGCAASSGNTAFDASGVDADSGGGGGGSDGGGGSLGSGGDGGGGSLGSGGGGGGGADGGGEAGSFNTPPCDRGLAVDDPSAASFAKAMGICTLASQAGYGLVSATYSNAFGSTTPPHAGQWGLLPKFGAVVVPREGSTLGVLSSGYAREYDDAQGALINAPSTTMWGCPGTEQCVPWSPTGPEGVASDFINSSPDGPLNGFNYPTGVAPPGYPKAAQGCDQSMLVNDMIDLKLVLKAPTGATGFQFDLDFYSSEWPNTVCSEYNDAFVAYLTSTKTTGNISYDPNKNPIAVNADFFNRCTPNTPLGCAPLEYGPAPQTGTSTCSAGTSELQGTGYADLALTWCETNADVQATVGGATGWLTTTAPIQGGEEFLLELMIWDAGDGLADSSILLDHFQWLGTPVTAPVTQPAPK